MVVCFYVWVMASARQRPADGFYEEFFSSDEESIDSTEDETILEKDATEQEQDILAAEQNRIVEKMKKKTETKGILDRFFDRIEHRECLGRFSFDKSCRMH